jgi:hypothetical protein
MGDPCAKGDILAASSALKSLRVLWLGGLRKQIVDHAPEHLHQGGLIEIRVADGADPQAFERLAAPLPPPRGFFGGVTASSFRFGQAISP